MLPFAVLWDHLAVVSAQGCQQWGWGQGEGVPWGTAAADSGSDGQGFHSSSENGWWAEEGFGTGEGAQRMDYTGRQLLAIRFKLAEAGRNCVCLWEPVHAGLLAQPLC